MWDAYGRLEVAQQHIAELHAGAAARSQAATGLTTRKRWVALRWATGGALVRLGERVATSPARIPVTR